MTFDMDDVQEKVHLVRWRDSLLEQLEARRAEDASRMAVIERLEESTAASADMIKLMMHQNEEYKREAVERAEQKAELRKVKELNGKIKKTMSDLRFAAAASGNWTRQPLAFPQKQESISRNDEYKQRIELFEQRLREKEEEITRKENEKQEFIRNIERNRAEIELLDREIGQYEDLGPEIAAISERIASIESLIDQRASLEATYARLQSELQSLHEETTKAQQQKGVHPMLKRDYMESLRELNDLRAREARLSETIARLADASDGLSAMLK